MPTTCPASPSQIGRYGSAAVQKKAACRARCVSAIQLSFQNPVTWVCATSMSFIDASASDNADGNCRCRCSGSPNGTDIGNDIDIDIVGG